MTIRLHDLGPSPQIAIGPVILVSGVGLLLLDGREYTTIGQMTDWAIDAGLTLERSIPKIVFGLYAVMNDEKILIFSRPV